MKTAFSVVVLVALAALVLMSLAPSELVGVRTGIRSLGGVATAAALAVVTLAGIWAWQRERRNRND